MQLFQACPRYKPKTSSTNHDELHGGPNKKPRHDEDTAVVEDKPEDGQKYCIKTLVVKLPLSSLIATSAPPTVTDTWDSMVLDYTVVAVAPSLLLNKGVEAWLGAGNVLP